MDKNGANLFKEMILNVRKPHVIRNMKLPWKCFELSFKEWCELFDKSFEDEETIKEFEFAPKKHYDSPQWEKFRKTVPLSFNEFYEKVSTDDKDDFTKNNWISFNYKNNELLPNACKEGVSFEPLGFTDVDQDITFWLGSEGAHTPCHYDTYGCNIVVQVYGKKMWLLFPPTTNLIPVRIPYEESSVYCSDVFYSPADLSKFKLRRISGNCYKFILEPGDILIVPNKWWHYVENLTPALNFNCWIPLEKDYEASIEECIVKFIVESMIKNSTENESEDSKSEILNPNEDIVGEEAILHVLEHLIEDKLNVKETFSNKCNYQYLNENGANDFVKMMKIRYKNITIEEIKNISENEFFEILKLNSNKRYNNENKPTDSIKKILINSICDPKTIERIKDNFINKYLNKNR